MSCPASSMSSSFQSTLPCGSDNEQFVGYYGQRKISIHAPLRERLRHLMVTNFLTNFNPRSLAGATTAANQPYFIVYISIHAPLRERQQPQINLILLFTFQSTLPCGSDFLVFNHFSASWYFNPRSLAGATAC